MGWLMDKLDGMFEPRSGTFMGEDDLGFIEDDGDKEWAEMADVWDDARDDRIDAEEEYRDG